MHVIYKNQTKNMRTQLDGLKKKLPHGAIKAIAQSTGISTTTISQVLNGNITSPKQSEILTAAAEYLTEYRAKEKEAIEALNKVLNPTN
jgi:transcriptional regulator with XRE-family HTH domain